MILTNPARRLDRLTAVAAEIATPEGAQVWGAHVTIEIDRIQAKLHRLALAAQTRPNAYNINKARTYIAQVELAIDRAAEAQNRLNAMFFSDPPSYTAN